MSERAPESGQSGATSKTGERLRRLRERYAWLDHLLRGAERYKAQYGDYYAAAITYFSVLALVPLLMIGFSAAGFVLRGDPALLEQAKAGIADAVPSQALSQMLGEVVDEAVASATAVGVFGLLTALYSGLQWMTNLREALTAQWSQRSVPPPFLRKSLSDLGALVGLGLAMAFSFAVTALGEGAGKGLLAMIGLEETVLGRALMGLIALALSLAANWLVFLWVLVRLPRKPVAVRSALRGALVIAVCFEVLKQVGVVYLNKVTSSPSGAAFGPILGLMVFAYLVSRLVLFVAAWTAATPEHADAAGGANTGEAQSPGADRPSGEDGPSGADRPSEESG